MTEKDFLEIVSLYAETWYQHPYGLRPWDYEIKKRAGADLKNINMDDMLIKKFQFGDRASTFVSLNDVMEQLVPNISEEDNHCLFRRLKPDLIETIRIGYDHCYKVSLRRLYERLQGLKLI